MSIFNYAYELLEVPATTARKGMKTLRNFRRRKYREFEFGPDKHQRVILYEPERVKHDAVILYFHGGGYMVGDPADLGVAADFYCGNGFRFISIGYRLLQDAPFPAQVEDAFRGYAVAMKILEMIDVQDPPVVVGGNSAGAHLAALLAYGTQLQRDFGVDTRSIVGVLSIAGVMDIRDILPGKSGPLAERFSDIWDPEELLFYSPIDVLDIDSTAHFLAIHGKQDRISPYTSELKFVKRLNTIDQARRELQEEAAREEAEKEKGSEEESDRVKTTGGGSTPVAKYTGWDAVSALAGEEELAQIIGLKRWKYQHIRLSAGIYTEKLRESRLLRMILRWLEKFDGLAIVLDPDPSFPAKAVLTRDTFHPRPEGELSDEDYVEEEYLEEYPELDTDAESGVYWNEDEYLEEETGPSGPADGYAAYYQAAYGEEEDFGAEEPTEAEVSDAQTLTAVRVPKDGEGMIGMGDADSPTIAAEWGEGELETLSEDIHEEVQGG